ncbi:MAG: sigma 54-dependent Fis family transcriptional regulator [Myxococcales bacterium]|nr:sigma 54-dependent Fis family transcriptional regulator [Myxococcales bacterium]
MTDRTIAVRGRAQFRGGTLSIVRGKGRGASIEVGREPVCVGRDPSCNLVVPDSTVSSIHAELRATPEGVLVRDLGSKNGTLMGAARIREALLVARCRLGVGDTLLELVPTEPERVAVPRDSRCGALLGTGARMRLLFDHLKKGARTDLTVLLLGETGTGKELAAAALHELSPRRDRPFVVVDCASIPATLAEATLFGHEKGAFTGADSRRISPFVEADGGTIFLDELGELPLDVQPKLLRALAERRVRAVGGSSYREVDVRVVAATRRDLLRAVNEGGFRSDLYFRVAQLRVELPPLRDRREDVPALVRHMLEQLGDPDAYERIPTEMMERLVNHDWPGNVRELKNAVTVAHALSDADGVLDVAAHVKEAADPGTVGAVSLTQLPYHEAKRQALTHFERDYFAALKRVSPDNVTEMARRAGLERAHVRKYLLRHGLSDPRRPSK